MNYSTDSLSFSNNYSLIENAFVDDSADISSDETLFSISPNGLDDSENQTPLPTITTPINENTSTPNNQKINKNSISNSSVNLIDIDEESIKDLTFTNKSIKIVQTQVKLNTDLKSILKQDKDKDKDKDTDEKSEISKTVTITTTLKSLKENKINFVKSATVISDNEIKGCDCGQIRFEKNQIKEPTYVNRACINKLKDQASMKSIDLKSQMVKYNEYLFYLKHGFPRKYD
jgi:hypothetical protein